MPVTTIKRCQSDELWWYTVEDCWAEAGDESGTGLTITYYDTNNPEGKVEIALGMPDALLIRDAINQLYPPTP